MLVSSRNHNIDWGGFMIKEELNELYWLNREIADLQRRLEELESNTPVGSSNLSGLPPSSTKSNPIELYVEKVESLRKRIAENMALAIQEKQKIEDFISTVADPEMRMIIRLRNIDLMGWFEIAEAMSDDKKHYDRTTVSKKYRKFLKSLKQKIEEKNII